MAQLYTPKTAQPAPTGNNGMSAPGTKTPNPTAAQKPPTTLFGVNSDVRSGSGWGTTHVPNTHTRHPSRPNGGTRDGHRDARAGECRGEVRRRATLRRLCRGNANACHSFSGRVVAATNGPAPHSYSADTPDSTADPGEHFPCANERAGSAGAERVRRRGLPCQSATSVVTATGDRRSPHPSAHLPDGSRS